MVIKVRSAIMLCSLCVALTRLCESQSLSPRAYIIVPIHSNAVTLTYSLSAGNVVFNDLPVTNSSGRIGSEIASTWSTRSIFRTLGERNGAVAVSVGTFSG